MPKSPQSHPVLIPGLPIDSDMRIIEHLRTRLASESGFTLIELVVVMQILAILTVIALPSYLSLKTSAKAAVTKQNVSSAIQASQAYYFDTVKNTTPLTYGGITGAKVRLEVPGVSRNLKAGAKTVTTTNDAFCIQDSEDAGQTFYHYEGGVGGAAAVLTGACPTAYHAT